LSLQRAAIRARLEAVQEYLMSATQVLGQESATVSSEGMPPRESASHPGAKIAASGTPLVQAINITKQYLRGKKPVRVLENLNLSITPTSFVALMGPSGSGKSTLLNIIAGLDTPTTGSLVVEGVDLAKLGDDERANWRAQHVGFIFQTFNLMPVLTALENVALPLLLTRLSAAERERRATTALEVVGLAERLHHYPNELSGGQEQRVAIARAIVTDPALIVADEPTGDLDRQSADDVLQLMQVLCKDLGKTIVMVTHDPVAAERANVLYRLDKGALV
jgi:putative ABC transport system ATP-binding protein